MFLSSYTTTASSTFTVTHAKHITARIKTDLKRLNQLYPEANLSDSFIDDLHQEVTLLLSDGYLKSVTYGFKKEVESLFSGKSDVWAVALKYEVVNGELDGGSDTPGGIRPGCDTEGAAFYSFLTYSPTWDSTMTPQERQDYKTNKLPIQRTGASEPTANWSQDRSYGKGGRSVTRFTTY